MKVLVAGATGYLGKRVVEEMHARGHQVRALARSHAGPSSVRDAVSELHLADATDTTALAGCCDGVDAVFTAIGLVGHSGRQTCWDVDHHANLNLFDQAQAAGVGKFIYTSVARSPGPGPGCSRAGQGRLRRRPSAVRHAVHLSLPERATSPARENRGFVFSHDTYRINPIDGTDVAASAADALHYLPSATVDLGGPDALTHEQVLRIAFDAVDTPPRITHLPLSLRAGLGLLGRLTPLRSTSSSNFP